MARSTARSIRRGRSSRLSAVAIAGLAISVVLGGCSGDGDDPEASSEASADAGESPSEAESVDPARTSPSDLPDPPKVVKPAGAAKDASVGKCPTAKGRRKVSGEVTSSAEAETDYLVTISWITDQYDVMGVGFAELKDMQPGETREFTVRAKVAAGATQCTTNVQYGELS